MMKFATALIEPAEPLIAKVVPVAVYGGRSRLSVRLTVVAIASRSCWPPAISLQRFDDS